MSLQSGSSSELDIENVLRSSKDTSSNDDMIFESVLELSKTQERKLFRKFGIFHSTSTSAKKIKEHQHVPVKTLKKRRISVSTSFKKAKKAKNLTTIKKSHKVKKLSTDINQKRSGTFTVEESSEKPVDSRETLAKFPDSILDSDFEDFDANIEHDSIVTKYGLPYEIIQCTCHLKEEVFGLVKNSNEIPNSVCITGSCYDFEELYGKTNQASRYTKEAKKSEDFQAACKIYDGMMRKSGETITGDEFSGATTLMKMYYPYYWRYLSKKDPLYLQDYDISKEKFSKTQVTISCMRLLKEQDLLSKHYRMKMEGLKDGEEFNDRLNHNFTIACSFLKREYPNLFVYLIKKYRFTELLRKKLEIIRNRLRIVKRMRSPHKQLKRLDDFMRRDRTR